MFTEKKMPKLIPPPERESLEKEIHALFTNGDLSDIARLLQKDLATVSRAFSPFDTERHNPVYNFLLHLWAFDAIRDGLAAEVLNIVLREREKWLPKTARRECPAKLTGNVGKELMEAVEKEIEGESFDVQIKEWVDVEQAARKKKNDLIAKRNVRYFEGNDAA